MNDRIYKGEDDQWYFAIRGNQRGGPFRSYDDAEAGLNRHVDRCKQRLGGAPLRWPRSWNPLKALRRSAARHG
jgi:hypothetical protein